MKASRYSDSQTMIRLNKAEAGRLVPELCREHGIPPATFYKWHSKHECERLCLQPRTDLPNIQEIEFQISCQTCETVSA